MDCLVTWCLCFREPASELDGAELFFEFDEKSLERYGVSKDEILTDVRKYAKENNVTEWKKGHFQAVGENGMGILALMAWDELGDTIEINPDYIECIKEIYICKVGEEFEGCLEALMELYVEDYKLDKKRMEVRVRRMKEERENGLGGVRK